MSVKVKGAELRRKLNRRGLTGADLAEAGGMATATVSHALNDRPISPRSYRKIVETLATFPECGDGLLEE
jgi:transcriptional regulator with XRE-family HTH domain